MGRRSINTTKSGKFMNPTDQARKEARKKELKKNKKQRLMVRTAVLKGKDPQQILVEMEKIDEMEFNPLQEPSLNEKVLKEKRRKLKETFDRVVRLYEKEDPEHWAELKRLESDYEKKRAAVILFWESVRNAQQVQVDDIPLPSIQMILPQVPSQIPLPPSDPVAMLAASVQFVEAVKNLPAGILKKSSVYDLALSALKKIPPGVPPGPPPELSEDEEEPENEFLLHDRSRPAAKRRRIRFNDGGEGSEGDDDREEGEVYDEMGGAPGTNEVEEFLKEMETAVGRSRSNDHDEEYEDDQGHMDDMERHNDPSFMRPPHGHMPNVPHGMRPMMFRGPHPHMMRMGMRMPPGPPPGLPPRFLGSRLPPGAPGPPPGMPPFARMPNMGGPPRPQLPGPSSMTQLTGESAVAAASAMSGGGGSGGTQSVLSAGPQLIRGKEETDKKGPTIEAKPQIRNLSADVIRFMPTSVRMKKGGDDKRKDYPMPSGPIVSTISLLPEKKDPNKVPAHQNKDDAYMQFMREMEGLL